MPRRQTKAAREEKNTVQPSAQAGDQAAQLDWRAMLFDDNPNGVLVIDLPTDMILAANAEACRLLGYPADDLRRLPHTAIIDLEDPRVGNAAVMTADARQFRGELSYRRADGAFFLAEATYTRYSSANGAETVCAFFTDISERKATESELLASKEMYRILAEDSPDAISMSGAEGRVHYLAPAHLRRIGYDERELLGIDLATMGSFIHPDDRGRIIAEVERGRDLKLPTSSYEYRVRTRTGDYLWIEDRLRREFDARGEIRHTVVNSRDITDRRRAEEALATSQARLRALIENTDASIWSVDRECRLLIANNVFDRAITAIIGRPLQPGESVLHPAFSPEIHAFWQANYDRALAGERIVMEINAQLYEAVRPLELHLMPILEAGVITGVAGLSRDVSERRRAETEARTALQRLQMAMRAAAIGMWTLELADERLEWDERTYELYAIAADERARGLTMKQWRARVHPDDLTQTEKSLAVAIETGVEQESSFRIVLPGGQIRYVHSVYVTESAAEGKPLRVVGVHRDITEQKTYERVLQDTNAELEQRVAARTAELGNVLEELRQAAALKDEFMAAVSHELRTPLNGVLATVDLLEMQIGGPLTPRQQRYVHGIRDSGERLLTMVNSILRYTELIGGGVTVHQEPCRLADLCAIALRTVRTEIEAKSLLLTFRITPADAVIISDSEAILQVLQHLLSNATKFTLTGGKIGLEVDQRDTEGYVQIVVWDTGVGIPLQLQQAIFEPFVQGDASLARRFEGMGLGLAYVQRMVKLLGGAIDLTSQPDAGSRFTISLPLNRLGNGRLPRHERPSAVGAFVASKSAQRRCGTRDTSQRSAPQLWMRSQSDAVAADILSANMALNLHELGRDELAWQITRPTAPRQPRPRRLSGHQSNNMRKFASSCTTVSARSRSTGRRSATPLRHSRCRR